MQIHTFNTPQETARAVTHSLLKEIGTLPEEYFHLAISGGKTAESLFQLWAEIYSKSIPWNRIQLYWTNEYCGEPETAETNYRTARAVFLEKVGIPARNIHRIQGGSDPEKEAGRYNTLVREKLPDYDGYPRFDMLILGVGTDGHTAGIFPGQPDLLMHRECYAVSTNPANGKKWITLTGQPLLRARTTLLHVVGAKKTDIVSSVTIPNNAAMSCPAAFISRYADNPHYFIDEPAAKKIKTELLRVN